MKLVGLTVLVVVGLIATSEAGAPPKIPNAPSDLAAMPSSTTQIDLAWTDNSNDETGFKIERKTGEEGIWGQIATIGANVTAYNDTGLAASTQYYYRVRAYNDDGDSDYSKKANATTWETIIAADTFMLNGTTRVEGTDLEGLTVETGTGTWVTSGAGTYLFTADGAISDPPGVAGEGAAIPFTPVAGTTYTLQADVTPAGTWISIGFGKGYSVAQDGGGFGRAWFFLDVCTTRDDCWRSQFFDGPSTNGDRTQHISFVPGVPYTLRTVLLYNPGGTSVATSYVNGDLLWGPYEITNINAGDITSAGFKMQGTTAGSRVDNFQLSASTP